MVSVITANNRRNYTAQMNGMHRDRKTIFVDTLKWDVPVVDGQYEIDQYDNERAIYLLNLDEQRQRHLGSVRLLPSTGPHILGDIFPMLCDHEVPRGEDIWEATRLCTAPHLRRREAWLSRSYLAVAMAEFALLYGIRKYTCVAASWWISSLMDVGWECEMLGQPKDLNGQSIGALLIDITPATLKLFRLKMGWRYPVLELDAAIGKAA